MEKSSLDVVRGTLDVLILKTLSWGAMHGYAISQTILRQTDEALLVEEGALYPALYRMEGKGWLEAEWGVSENNRRAKYYRLTSRGRLRTTAGPPPQWLSLETIDWRRKPYLPFSGPVKTITRMKALSELPFHSRHASSTPTSSAARATARPS